MAIASPVSHEPRNIGHPPILEVTRGIGQHDVRVAEWERNCSSGQSHSGFRRANALIRCAERTLNAHHNASKVTSPGRSFRMSLAQFPWYIVEGTFFDHFCFGLKGEENFFPIPLS